MKAFFGMTAAALLVVTMLFAALPGNALAEKVTAAEMVKVKKAADEAAQSAKAQLEKASTDEEKLLAKWLLKQAETNAEVAGELLEEVKAGKDVSRQDVAFCAAIAKAVHEAAGALAAGDMAKAEDALDRIARMSSNLPTAANARAEMERTDRAVWNQPVVGGRCPWGGENKWPIGYENNGLGQMCPVYLICYRHRLIPWSWWNTWKKKMICPPPPFDPPLACTCTGGGGWASAAAMNPAARFAFDRNCVNGQVVEDSCRYPSPSVPHNCPCPAPAR